MRNEKGQFKKGTKSDKRGVTLTETGQICASCKIDKSLDCFGKNNQRFNGVHVYCKECCKVIRQKRGSQAEYMSLYYQAKKQILIEKQRARYKERKELYLAAQKMYYQKNTEKVAAINKKWAEENREAINLIKSNWKKRNIGAVRYHNSLRREGVRKQMPLVVDKKAIKDFYANCPKGMEVDHITPISKGGSHSIENLQYLLPVENRRKYNKIIDYSAI